MTQAHANFKNGQFHNIETTRLAEAGESTFKILYDFIFHKSKESYPNIKLPAARINKNRQADLAPGEVCVNWLGHSTLLLTTNELSVITDPVFIKGRLSPYNLGPKKFGYEVESEINDLPPIDVVLISHDHYDHLDKQSVLALKESTFYVPLGVKSRLVKWGINEANITEFDWGDQTIHTPNLTLEFCPARHFSGRGLFDRNKTLWGSWVINLGGKKIYFGGDSGYSEEFKKIGQAHGPFDLVMLDNGQYNEAWRNVHMMPVETVQAAIDLQAKKLLPIHNSKFVLSLHSWFEPLDRVTKEAKLQGLSVTTPMIGEELMVGKNEPDTCWWRT